jgi:hypothetical protein
MAPKVMGKWVVPLGSWEGSTIIERKILHLQRMRRIPPATLVAWRATFMEIA